jgi:hypothetical protein
VSGEVPIVEDVAFRLSENGEFFGMDFNSRDGRMRSAVFSAPVLTKLIAGLLWSASEAGLRGVEAPLSAEALAALGEGAPVVTGLELTPKAGGAVLEMTLGAAVVVARLPDESLRALLLLLADYFEADLGGRT